jgi:Ca-activated chloride channel family protein
MAAAAILQHRERALAEAPQADPVAGLTDIPLPAPISLWPQTWPLRIVVAVVVAGALLGIVRLIRSWHRNRYRRAALAELAGIEGGLGAAAPADTSVALAALVRRTALAAFPRDQVASLAGPAWLSFLDRTANTKDFSEGAGRSLEIRAYRPAPEDAGSLIGAVRHWIKAHHA